MKIFVASDGKEMRFRARVDASGGIRIISAVSLLDIDVGLSMSERCRLWIAAESFVGKSFGEWNALPDKYVVPEERKISVDEARAEFFGIVDLDYADLDARGDSVILDGWFTIDKLRKIVAIMERIK